MPSDSLSTFLAATEARIRGALQTAPLHPEQRRILVPVACDESWRLSPLRHTLAPYYLLIRAHGVEAGTTAQRIGAGVLLAQRCMCMIDDVEDDELAGAAAQAGSIVAINAGLTLYLLAVEQLRRAEPEILGFGERPLWQSLYTHALRLSQAQHRDISGRGQVRSPAEAVDLATEKSAICCMLFEYAGMCGARGDEVTLQAYRTAGDAMACIQQVVDDISDLFSPKPSADLRTGTWNVPLSFFLDALDPVAREIWLKRLHAPATVDQQALGEALYESGAMQAVADLLEAKREVIHRELARVTQRGPYLAMLLAWSDDLAALVYKPDRRYADSDIVDVEPIGLVDDDVELYQRLRGACITTRSRIAVGG